MTLRLRRLALPVRVLGVLLLFAAVADACTCAAWSTFDEVARRSAVAIVARVAAIGPNARPTTATKDPSYIDLEVLWVGKGAVQAASRLRLWNESAGSSCGGAFKNLSVGAEIVAAFEPVEPLLAQSREAWQAAGFTPGEADYLMFGGCGDYFLVLTSSAQREKYVGRPIP